MKWIWMGLLGVLGAALAAVVAAGAFYVVSANLFAPVPTTGQTGTAPTGQTGAVSGFSGVAMLLVGCLTFIGTMTAQILGWRFARNLEEHKAVLQRQMAEIQKAVQAKGVDYKLSREGRYSDQNSLYRFAWETYQQLRDVVERLSERADFDPNATRQRLQRESASVASAGEEFARAWNRQVQLAMAFCEALAPDRKDVKVEELWIKKHADYHSAIKALREIIRKEHEQALELS